MILIGLTGGVASGKSTVSRLLEAKGARIIDADRLGHEAYSHGSPAYEAVVDRFGPEILTTDGQIDRKSLGEIVFTDASARADLEAIVHPEIFRSIVQNIDKYRDTDEVVVVDAALLVEMGRGKVLGLEAMVVVSTDVETQIRRMIDDRGMTDEEARARIGAQGPATLKLASADYVIDNRTHLDDLKASVDTLWNDLKATYS